MSNEVIPLVSFGKIEFFGNPHHGLVRSGTLTKSDSSTKTWTQPMSGDTRLVRFDGTPAVERTTQQITADAVAHYEWRDYGIISGGQLYGENVGDIWLYKDGNGRVWNCVLTLESWSQATGIASMKVAFSEFGLVDIPANAEVTPSGELNFSVVTDISGASIVSFKRADISPDGKKAIIRLKLQAKINWIEITLSGDINKETMSGLVAVSVVKKDVSQSHVKSDDGPVYTGVNEWFHEGFQRTTGGDAWPRWTASQAGSPKKQTDTDTYVNGSESGAQLWTGTPYTEDIEAAVIIWAFYDATGLLKFIKAEAKYNDIYAPTLTKSVTGSIELEQTSKVFDPATDIENPSSDAPLEIGVISGSSYSTGHLVKPFDITFTYAFYIDETKISELTVTSLQTFQETLTLTRGNALPNSTYITYYQANPFWNHTTNTPENITVPGDGDGSNTRDNPLLVTDWDGTEYPIANRDDPGTIYDPFMPDMGEYKRAVEDMIGSGEVDISFDGGFIDTNDNFDVLFMSNKLCCVRIRSKAKDKTYYRELANPNGSDPALFDIPTITTSNEKGTFQPETGDIQRNESEDICFV